MGLLPLRDLKLELNFLINSQNIIDFEQTVHHNFIYKFYNLKYILIT